jgi:hypothetical protein
MARFTSDRSPYYRSANHRCEAQKHRCEAHKHSCASTPGAALTSAPKRVRMRRCAGRSSSSASALMTFVYCAGLRESARWNACSPSLVRDSASHREGARRIYAVPGDVVRAHVAPCSGVLCCCALRIAYHRRVRIPDRLVYHVCDALNGQRDKWRGRACALRRNGAMRSGRTPHART